MLALSEAEADSLKDWLGDADLDSEALSDKDADCDNDWLNEALADLETPEPSQQCSAYIGFPSRAPTSHAMCLVLTGTGCAFVELLDGDEPPKLQGPAAYTGRPLRAPTKTPSKNPASGLHLPATASTTG
jgi:hypothetical protein